MAHLLPLSAPLDVVLLVGLEGLALFRLFSGRNVFRATTAALSSSSRRPPPCRDEVTDWHGLGVWGRAWIQIVAVDCVQMILGVQVFFVFCFRYSN